MNRFALGRYLDYCSEMLSITSKMAALHIQDLKDPVVLGAVRDVESLAGNLQGKIWQKKQILDAARSARRTAFGAGLRSTAGADSVGSPSLLVPHVATEHASGRIQPSGPVT